MKPLPVLLLPLLAAGAVWGQGFQPAANTSATSASGQFQVQAAQPFAARLGAVPVFADTNVVRLEPTLLVIAAERVKAILWRELQIRGAWQQKVYFVLRPARTAADPVTVKAVMGLDGWALRAEAPDHLGRHEFIRLLVEVVLLELANRSGTDRGAELPTWLADGLAFHLLANHAAELVLEAPRHTANGVTFTPLETSRQRLSELEQAHKILVGETPLSFEQLSWPNDAQLRGPGRQHYLASAQVFAVSLLRLRDGPACYRAFLAALPAYRNWQLALLKGFAPHFTRLLDVDKWWTLEAAQFAGRDLTQTWGVAESWRKLAETLREPARRATDETAPPERTELSLQEVLREWEPEQRADCLRRKTMALVALRLRLAPELVPLADEYRRTLELWLRARAPETGAGARGFRAPGDTAAATIRRLNQLDDRLARWQSAVVP